MRLICGLILGFGFGELLKENPNERVMMIATMISLAITQIQLAILEAKTE